MSIDWIVSQSVAIDLDIATEFALGNSFIQGMGGEAADLLNRVPPDWREQAYEMFGRDDAELSSRLCYAAHIAGVIAEADYGKMTLAIREMTIADATERLADLSNASPDVSLPPAERFVALAEQVYQGAYRSLPDVRTHAELYIPAEVSQVVRMLRDGDLGARYWYWLDRFYYEVLLPWREARADRIAVQAASVEAFAAADTPLLDWLPAQNALRHVPGLLDGVERDQLKLLLYAEPFGLADLWLLFPDMVAISYAEMGALYQNFREFAEDLTARTKAISDPTRLIILRLIRNYGMTNTEIADYMGIARPTVSVHAKVLREAGLIDSRQEGRVTRHEIVPEAVRKLMRELQSFLDIADEPQPNERREVDHANDDTR